MFGYKAGGVFGCVVWVGGGGRMMGGTYPSLVARQARLHKTSRPPKACRDSWVESVEKQSS